MKASTQQTDAIRSGGGFLNGRRVHVCALELNFIGASREILPEAGDTTDPVLRNYLGYLGDHPANVAEGVRRLAAEDAGYVPPEEAYATSVFLAAGSGGNEFSQHEIQGLWAKGPRSVGAYQSIAWFYAATTGQMSEEERTEFYLRHDTYWA